MLEKAKPHLDHQRRGSRLIIRRHFTSPIARVEIEQRIRDYLEALDYKRSGADHLFVYQRGSRLTKRFSFEPRYTPVEMVVKLSSEIDINTDIDVTLYVDFGFLPHLRLDYEFWHAEIDGVESAVTSGEINLSNSLQISKRAKHYSYFAIIMTLVLLGSCFLLVALQSLFCAC
jgi:hypothetical protein